MGVYSENGNKWYSRQYPDFEITDSARDLVYHLPSGEEEESAPARCEFYLRRLHTLHLVLIFILWGATVAYRVVTSVGCGSAFALLGVLTAAEILGMIFEFATVRKKVAVTLILEETELPSKRQYV